MDITAPRRRTALNIEESLSCEPELRYAAPSSTESKEVVACVPDSWGQSPMLPRTYPSNGSRLTAEQLPDLSEAALDQQLSALRRRLSVPADYPAREADQLELDVIENELRTRVADKSDFVQICGRPADLPIIGGVSEHRWLRTRAKAAGMGAADDTRLPGAEGQSSFPGDKTMLVDHAKDTPVHCDMQPNVDESCVNRELEIGKDTGRWWPWNQCHTVVDDIVERCTKK